MLHPTQIRVVAAVFLVGSVALSWATIQRSADGQQRGPSSSGLAARRAAGNVRSSKLALAIAEGDWGGAPHENIAAVCLSASNELTKFFPRRDFDPILLSPDPKAGPMVVYGKGPAGERRVLLNTKGTAWSQYSYQFAHELCHILCNYRRARNPQLWFEESMCETASIFVIRRMSQTWRKSPPYPNWKSYADSLERYAKDHTAKTSELPGTFAEWFARNEDALRKTGTDRPLNQVVAVHGLLPLLEKSPRHWEAVSYLNQWDVAKEPSFTEYLLDWRERAGQRHRAFIDDVAKQFGLSLAS